MGKNQSRHDNGQFGPANLGATAPSSDSRTPENVPLPDALNSKNGRRSGEPSIEEVYELLMSTQAMIRTVNTRLDEMTSRMGNGGGVGGNAGVSACPHPAYRFLHDRIEPGCSACEADGNPCQLQICIECGADYS
jgi:hypothetical protein